MRFSFAIYTIIVLLSILCWAFPTVNETFALLPGRTFFGSDTWMIPNFWNVFTCHYFDVQLLRCFLTLPIIVGLLSEAQSFLTSPYLAQLLVVTTVASGVFGCLLKITLWLISNNEFVYFSPSSSLFCILGCLVVVFSQFHLPNSIAPSALFPLPPSSGAPTLPATPVAFPPILLLLPVIRFSVTPQSPNDTNPYIKYWPISKLSNLLSSVEFQYKTWDVIKFFYSNSKPLLLPQRPSISSVDSLVWRYVAIVICWCGVSSLLIYLSTVIEVLHFVGDTPLWLSLKVTLTDLVFAISGCYTSWFYLRFLSFYVTTNTRGDASEEFGFPFLFPSTCEVAAASVAVYCWQLSSFFKIDKLLHVPQCSPIPRIRNLRVHTTDDGLGATAYQLNALSGGLTSNHIWEQSQKQMASGGPASRALRAKGLMVLERHMQQNGRQRNQSSAPVKPTRENTPTGGTDTTAPELAMPVSSTTGLVNEDNKILMSFGKSRTMAV